MTSHEQQLLQDLCARLSLTQGQPKDPQAEAELRHGLTGAPDAVYWLAQRTLMLEQALQQAQQQIEQLQQQVQQAQQAHQSQASSGSFLSGGLGTQFGRAPEPYAQEAGYAQNAQTSQAQYQPQATQQSSSWRDRFFGGGAPSRVQAPQAYAPPAASGSGGFLGSAAAAAAGVAGGMFLANGLGNLMGGHHASSNSLFGGGDSAAQNLHGSAGDVSGMADDAGLGSIDNAASDSWDDGGSFSDDDFA
jgi:hypothetical protein